ncbi:hypothetical protein NOC27_2881 [Nitrosococcus oceani AFC27]|nr:hypothetical protein NOC27_2881 [Nitrosococcus oceani AFC27]
MKAKQDSLTWQERSNGMKFRTLPLVLAMTGVAGFVIAAEKAAIEVSPQPAGSEITVDSVTVPDDGFVVIHASDEHGNIIAPQSIGYSAVKSGTQEDVSVSLDEEVASGDKVFVMLHEDTGEKGTYEFGVDRTDVDVPVIQDGKPVIAPMDIE